MKAVLREKFVDLQAYLKKQEKSKKRAQSNFILRRIFKKNNKQSLKGVEGKK